MRYAILSDVHANAVAGRYPEHNFTEFSAAGRAEAHFREHAYAEGDGFARLIR